MNQIQITIDKNQTIQLISGDVEQMLGVDGSYYEGRHLHNIIPERLRDAHEAGFGRYIQTGSKRAMGSWIDVPVMRADGEEARYAFCVTENGQSITAIMEDRSVAEDAPAQRLAKESYRDTIETLYRNAELANHEWASYDDDSVKRIVEAMLSAAQNSAKELADLAASETDMGNPDSKKAKNLLAAERVYEEIVEQKTVGLISESESRADIATPMGTILCVIPVTNPTSTTIFKALCALRARNSIIILPARKAAMATTMTAKALYEAAIEAGAPEHCIQWVSEGGRELTQALFTDKRNALILATGGMGLVESAYSSGTPALGVGAGNVPVMVDDSADMENVAECLVTSKTFDNGVICASEQLIVSTLKGRKGLLDALAGKGAYLVPRADAEKLAQLCVKEGKMNPGIVGKTAEHIAEKAGISIPDGTKLLMTEIDSIGQDEPMSTEVLAPVIAFYTAPSVEKGIDVCRQAVELYGRGHTAVIHTKDRELAKKYGEIIDAGRILVNVPSSLGAVGSGTDLNTSFTLGCGTGGKNITTDNITAKHLINVRRIAWPSDS